MESTGLSVGKSVLDGALGYAASAVAEEVALQLHVRRDQAFIRDELETMQGFLMTAHDERDDNKVVKIWVKQVRDVAYDVEDCLLDFAVRLEKQSWWRIPRTLLNRRRVAKEMKELRAKVEDVSQRNARYNLIKGSASKTATVAEQSNVTAAAIFGMDEARRAAKKDKVKVDLLQLIDRKDDDLRVIAVWGTSADLGQTSIINAAYENPDIRSKFASRAWVGVMHPFNPKDFVQSLVEQFHTAVGVDIMLETDKTGRELAQEFNKYVKDKRYLIVLNDLSTIEEWNRVKKCFPDNQNRSRIIVSTAQAEIARLMCRTRKHSVRAQAILYGSEYLCFLPEDGKDLAKAGSSSNDATTSIDYNSTVPTGEILEDQPNGASGKNALGKSLTRIRTMVTSLEESHLVGREKEKSEIINIISKQATEGFQVISVWGMGGLGKSTIVRDIYESQELNDTFDKRACVTVPRPFNMEDLLRSLVTQMDGETSDVGGTRKKLAGLMEELDMLLERKRCLIVLDDVSSTAEWDLIIPSFHKMENKSRIIVTTREENIAEHCSVKPENIYMLRGLEDQKARDLFMKKVFKETVNLNEQYPELAEQADLILSKCSGLPLAIITIGGFLANQQITASKWRKLNEHISAELEMNPKLETIRTVLVKSYDGLPYHLKSCFLYVSSIFPEDRKVSRRRLVRRWTAEGYSREIRDKSAEEIADNYFLELIKRSMILPSRQSTNSRKGIDSCQVHDLMREIGISKSMEENLVFRLEEGCSLYTQGTVRHLAISSNWDGDQSQLESIVDLSRVRSITVFGQWKVFFISDKMRLLRVLDLQDTSDLHDHHLKNIGKLLHLKYLSLRGCGGIFHLPDSLGNLKQLQTLDVRGTNIVKLPKSIVKLQKLNYLRAGREPEDEDIGYEKMAEGVPKLMRNNRLCVVTFYLALFCFAYPISLFTDDMDQLNSRDVCTAMCCVMLPAMAMRLDLDGVLAPRGMKKMKALHTLGVVNIAQGKVIKGLTRLRKLAVTGISKRNGQAFCTAIAGLSLLESLSIRSEGEPGLCGCLDVMSLPPKNLQSLKLYGNLVRLPEWVKGLHNLVKLYLRSTRLLEHDAAMHVLGKIPNLAILRLWDKSFQGEVLHFQSDVFGSLMVLELAGLEDIRSVKFDQGAMPKLEQLQLRNLWGGNENGFVGLDFLPSIKEVWFNVKISYLDHKKIFSNGFNTVEQFMEETKRKSKLKEDKFKEHFRTQLAQNPMKPIILKVG